MVETNGRSLTREATAQSDNNFVDNSFLEYVPSSFYVLHFFMIIEAWCVIIKCLPRVYIFLFSEYFSLAEREREVWKETVLVCSKGSRVTNRERNSRRDDVCLTNNLQLGKEGNVPGGMPWNADWESKVEPGYTSTRISLGLVPDFEPWGSDWHPNLTSFSSRNLLTETRSKPTFRTIEDKTREWSKNEADRYCVVYYERNNKEYYDGNFYGTCSSSRKMDPRWIVRSFF